MSKNSRPFTTSTVRIFALLIVILISLTFATDWLITSSENQEFRDRYKEIELGMPESMVVSLLGTPNDRSSEFYLGQREGLEEAYERAAQIDSDRRRLHVVDSSMPYCEFVRHMMPLFPGKGSPSHHK